MPRPLSPLPASLAPGPFLFRDAVAAGVSRRLLRDDGLLHPHRGVYAIDSGEHDVSARAARLLPVLGQDQWLSHLSAARAYGAPLPFRYVVDEPLHVTAIGGAERVRRPGVVGWKTDDGGLPRMLRHGLPLIAPADVWCQLAVPGALTADPLAGRRPRLAEDWLVAVGDYLVTGPGRGQARTPLCSIDDLEEATRRRRGKRGAASLAAALPRVRSGPQSPEETRLRLALVEAGLPEPEIQLPVMTAAGLRHADLGYRLERSDRLLLLEFQGDHHRTDRRQWLADLTRVQLFEDAGHRTMLIGYDDVHPDCRALAARVRRALRA